MPAEPEEKGNEDELEQSALPRAGEGAAAAGSTDNGKHSDEEEEEEEEDEPRLKYTKLTGSLSSVYRNGDATSSFVVAGDKMVGPKMRPLRQAQRE